MKRIILAIFLCSMASHTVFSQRSESEYTPPSNSALGKDDGSNKRSSPYGSKENVAPAIKNIIQFNPTTLIRGNYFITYERALTNTFSLTAGFGKYFMIDAMGSMASDREYFSEEHVDYASLLEDGDFTLNESNFQLGFSGKIYLNQDDENRSYLELGARFYNEQYDNSNYKTTFSKTNEVESLKEANQQFFFNFGRQWNRGEGKFLFSHQFYVGSGIRRITMDQIETLNSNQGWYYKLTGTTATWCVPSILMGYKLGFGW